MAGRVLRTYEYHIRDAAGKLSQGVTEAVDEKAASRELQAKGFYVLAVRPARREHRQAEAFRRQVLAPIFYPASPKALSIFYSSMKAMLGAGFNIVNVGETLSQQTNNPVLKQAAREMAEAAKEGRPMSSVLRKYPSAFDSAAVAMIEAGEQSGMLERTVERLTEYYDREFELRQMYRWQTFYPKILLIALFVIPSLTSLILTIMNGGSLLPWFLGLLASAAGFLLVVGALWYGYRALRRFPAVRNALDMIKLCIPWFGSLARRMATARWARALSMLLSAGVPVQRSLEAAGMASGNSVIETGMRLVARMTERGRGLAESIATVRQIPRMAIDMLTTAEKAGSISLALDKIADYYESETEAGGKQTAVVVGVLIFLVIAAIIGFMVISFYGGMAQQWTNALDSAGK